MGVSKPALIALSGLPGVGKTTVARIVAERLNAVYLRIDSAEQALRRAGEISGKLNISGYEVCYALATDNLRLGLDVVADSVNPIAWSRNAWRNVANDTSSRFAAVELVCGDKAEHRRRVETRQPDIEGLRLPDWLAVENREYEDWTDADIRIDTAKNSAGGAAATILAYVETTVR